MEALPALGEEEPRLASKKSGAAVSQIGGDRARGRGRERDVSVLVPLALDDPHEAALGVDVLGPKLHELAHAHPGAVERLEDRAVA